MKHGALCFALATTMLSACGDDAATGTDAASSDAGPDAVSSCTPPSPEPLEVTIEFPSGSRTRTTRPFVDSFGTADPPPGTVFDDTWTPREGECSAATHDRYWVCGSDGRVYRTWHPSRTTDALTGQPCSFGHEHGDDPRESRIYTWVGGVPFGIANHAAGVGGSHHRHEDHVGHKVFVQNNFEAVIGNPPDRGPIQLPGFHCHWLSKVHQGTHTGDALGHNEHEYMNSIMCDDGAVRNPDPGWEMHAGPDDHTEGSVITLAAIGSAGSFRACDAGTLIPYPGEGRPQPAGADTGRSIKCTTDEFWTFNKLMAPITSETGDVDWEGNNIDELWKPWLQLVDRDGHEIFVASGYYIVANPARLYNDGSLVPKRDVNGDGAVDDYLPTLEVCLLASRTGREGCKGLEAFPSSVPQTEWWQLPQSFYNGTIRMLHPKGIMQWNATDREFFCTDYKGVEGANDPMLDAHGNPFCPEGQLLQRAAKTINQWGGYASWGPSKLVGHIVGSSVNAHDNKTVGAGYGHEWVRFYNTDPGIHAPN